MEIQVNNDVLMRLKSLTDELPRGEAREWLKSVFIERRSGHVFAGATNSLFAAVQYIGIQPGDDGFVAVSYTHLRAHET